MFPIGELFCPACLCSRLFVVFADSPAQVDPNTCECDVCGYQFGERGYVINDEVREGQRVVVTRPALDPRVLQAAQERYQEAMAQRLLEVGSSRERAREEVRLQAALDDPDLAARRAIVAAPKAALDPKLAQRVLDPKREQALARLRNRIDPASID